MRRNAAKRWSIAAWIFADAARLFQMRTIVHVDDREQYGEVRFQTIGFLDERLIMVVWTQRGDTRRIISMRKCNAREQRRYGKRVG